MATIRNTQCHGVATLSVMVGSTDYTYLYSAEVGNMPKFLQVEIGNLAIPIHYEVSDVVDTVTAYALGLENNEFTGIFVCVGRNAKRMDFNERCAAIITAINSAIIQAVDNDCFDGEFVSATTAEINAASSSITSHYYGMNQGRKTKSTAGYSGKPNNRRYPHTCTIRREVLCDDPMIDGALTNPTNDDPMSDDPMDDDDPMADDDPMSDSGDDNNGGDNGGDNNGNDGEDENQNGSTVITIYDGICRSEAKLTTNDSGDVLASTRRMSIPLTLEDWDKMEYKPKEGDRVDIWKGESYEEYGLIIDVMLGQLGTTILFKYVK